jgi:phenylalanyl-tRNA synthetase beta chain
MRVPLEWLYEYCEPHMDAQTLAARLALTGTEVERVEHHGVSGLDRFVVGKVLERRKHPDADRLSVCMVDVGGSTASQIVCGAPNVAAGQTVGVGRPGAIMPDGTELGRRKLRGQTSEGMILSERELEISTEHDGIMVLEDGIAPGTPLATVAPISTEVLVLEITPNRPDCLGVYGVAREVHAATGAPLKPPPWLDDPGTAGELRGIEITNEAGPELNPRFTARIFEGISLAESPRWLKARLMASGQRPISNVVDITNYVMLLTGQPMHAFDYDQIAGRRLNVRRAKPQEQMQTLDEQTRTLDDQMVVIEDGDGPTSLAGVMGGARSEVSDQTRIVLSEVATWNGPNVHDTSLKLALRSEASGRNEKGLQPEQTMWAQAVATKLFVEVCGATVRPGTLDLGGPGPEPASLPLRTARVESLLGTEVDRDTSARVLHALGFETTPTVDGLSVKVPDFRRGDVTREVDLIEEVARLEVLPTLPATLPARRSATGALTSRQKLLRRAADLLAGQGLNEVLGWSFAGPEQNQKLRLEHPQVKLLNPMSNEQSVLRTTLLGSVLDIAARNRDRATGPIRIFEMGAVYRANEIQTGVTEPVHVVGILCGPVRLPSWRESNPPNADFFAAKGVAEALLAGLGIEWTVEPERVMPALHPGRSAAISVDGKRVGFVAEVHPAVAAEWEFDADIKLATFGINLDALPLPPIPTYTDLTTFPEVREDLAVVVADTIPAADVLATVIKAGAPMLASAEVFDVYRDPERLGAGNVSLAIRLAYRVPDRTLTDAEVVGQRQRIVTALEDQLKGRIRDN